MTEKNANSEASRALTGSGSNGRVNDQWRGLDDSPEHALLLYRELLEHGFVRPDLHSLVQLDAHSREFETARFHAVKALAERDGLMIVFMWQPYSAGHVPIFEIACRADGQPYTTEAPVDLSEVEADWGETLEQARSAHAVVSRG